jgi:hypothetical protein
MHLFMHHGHHGQHHHTTPRSSDTGRPPTKED